MNRDDVQKLLGGYATGTLTPQEQEALFQAALEDQELFDALGREQALRDLLRDPAARVELLAAMDSPERAGFWRRLSRPAVAAVAIIAVVEAIAIVAVWQGTRGRHTPLAPATVAHVSEPDERADRLPATAPQAPKAATKPPALKERISPPRDSNAAGKKIAGTLAQPTIAPAPAPPPVFVPAAPPPQAMMASPGRSATATPAGSGGAAPESVPLPSVPPDNLSVDARSLFYANSFAPSSTAPAPLLGPGFSAGRLRSAKSNPTTFAAKTVGTPSTLGVRVTVLRGDLEAAVTTLLTPGEPIRLRLTPNENGFLYVSVYEGDELKTMAAGPVERLKPLETPTLPFQGSGQKQVYILFSRQAQTLSSRWVLDLTSNNVVKPATGQDPATYVVTSAPSAPPQLLVQTITLTYR